MDLYVIRRPKVYRLKSGPICYLLMTGAECGAQGARRQDGVCGHGGRRPHTRGRLAAALRLRAPVARVRPHVRNIDRSKNKQHCGSGGDRKCLNRAASDWTANCCTRSPSGAFFLVLACCVGHLLRCSTLDGLILSNSPHLPPGWQYLAINRPTLADFACPPLMPPGAGLLLSSKSSNHRVAHEHTTFSLFLHRSVTACSQALTVSKTYGSSSHQWQRGFPTAGAPPRQSLMPVVRT